MNRFKAALKRIFRLYRLEEVFTPSSSAVVSYVHRESLERELDKYLQQTGKAIIIYGNTGSGKTTLVNTILKQNKINSINIACESTTTYTDILSRAIDELGVYYVQQKKSSRQYRTKGTVGIEYAKFKANLDESNTLSTENISERVIQPQISAQKLASFLGEAHVILVLEDFHKVIPEEKKRLTDLIKVFIDEANHYHDLKVVCIGAVDSPRELIQPDSELKPRVAQIEVPLLSDDEIEKLIKLGSSSLNIEMSTALIDKIKTYSNHIASLAHEMCYDICYNEGICKSRRIKVKVSDEKFIVAVTSYINANLDLFTKVYEMCTKDSLGWYVLKTITTFSKSAKFSAIEKKINSTPKLKNTHKRRLTPRQKYSKEEIQAKLDLFTSDEYKVLRYNSNAETYSISSPFWGAFLKMQMEIERAETYRRNKEKRNPNLRFRNVDDTNNAVLLAFMNKFKIAIDVRD